MISYGIVEEDIHLYQILDLQKQNLKNVLSDKEIQEQGFVTIEHDFDLLKKMNSMSPHIVALDNNQVVGYALVNLKEIKKEIPLLTLLIDETDLCEFDGKQLYTASYVIMGQICIAKTYRGRGVFAGLYTEMKQRMRNQFDFIITEISAKNYRSLKAHAKVGFELLKKHIDENGDEWDIVVLRTEY